jgi:hypothetical protein
MVRYVGHGKVRGGHAGEGGIWKKLKRGFKDMKDAILVGGGGGYGGYQRGVRV